MISSSKVNKHKGQTYLHSTHYTQGSDALKLLFSTQQSWDRTDIFWELFGPPFKVGFLIYDYLENMMVNNAGV